MLEVVMDLFAPPQCIDVVVLPRFSPSLSIPPPATLSSAFQFSLFFFMYTFSSLFNSRLLIFTSPFGIQTARP